MGFGAMPLSGVYGEVEDDASMALLRHVVDSGVNLIDTSNSYGDGHNESLIGDALVDRRDRIVLATKFGMQGPGWGRRDRMREALDASLHRLQTDRIDLYYLHRVDRTTSIEATVEAMAELVDEGLIGGIGLSEISAETLIRAESIHPIAAVQQEYSLFTRDVEHELLPTMRELGIPLVAYSPLGRGILTGALRSPADLPENDERRTRYPRFDAGNLEANLAAAQALFDLADERGEHPTALALGWLLAQGEDIIPIPGTRRASNFDANLAVTRTQQDPEMVSALTGLFPLGQAKGDRYSAAMMAKLDG
jgi:aryl-alcohol dehydrogenase-like predicted oxidoreductase